MSSSYTLVDDGDLASSKFAKFSQESLFKAKVVIPSNDGVYKAVAMPNTAHAKHIKIIKTESQLSSTMNNMKQLASDIVSNFMTT